MNRIATAVGAALLLAACSSPGPAPQASPTEASATDSSGHDAVHWSYSGADGPENWGSLSPEFAECSTGDRQAPIAIDDPDPVKRDSPRLDYISQMAEVVNNGHSVEAAAGPGSSMTLDGKKYALGRMHFHAPAENIIDGVQYPAELHFVHESRDGKAAVLAVMLEEGPENPAFDAYLDQMDLPVDSETQVELPWPNMVPGNTRSIRFDGSLTTPDCTEGIAWNVAIAPLPVSSEQLDRLRSAYDDNARPVQPLNGRKLTIDAN